MNDPADLTLKFNARTLDYIVNTIAQRPYAECAAVLADISNQVQAQQKQKAPEGLLNGAGAESPALTQ